MLVAPILNSSFSIWIGGTTWFVGKACRVSGQLPVKRHWLSHDLGFHFLVILWLNWTVTEFKYVIFLNFLSSHSGCCSLFLFYIRHYLANNLYFTNSFCFRPIILHVFCFVRQQKSLETSEIFTTVNCRGSKQPVVMFKCLESKQGNIMQEVER